MTNETIRSTAKKLISSQLQNVQSVAWELSFKCSWSEQPIFIKMMQQLKSFLCNYKIVIGNRSNCSCQNTMLSKCERRRWKSSHKCTLGVEGVSRYKTGPFKKVFTKLVNKNVLKYPPKGCILQYHGPPT